MPDEIVIMIIAVVGLLGFSIRSIVKVVMDADIRKLELRHGAQSSENAASSSEIEQLRAEIAQLRETTTSHALSLQRSVERLDHRVEFVERRVSTSVTAESVQPETQQIGVRR